MSTILSYKHQQTIPHIYIERPGYRPRPIRIVGQSVDLNPGRQSSFHLKLPSALDHSDILSGPQEPGWDQPILVSIIQK